MLCLLLIYSYLLKGQQWTNVPLRGMGFVTGIKASIVSNDIYIRTDNGGVMRMDRVSNTWIPLMDDKNIGHSVEAIATHPSDPNVIFAAIGHKEIGNLFVSSDKGQRWDKMNLSLYMEGNGKWRQAGRRLAIDPNNGHKRMYYASRENGLQISYNNGLNWYGVSKSKLPHGKEAGQTFICIDTESGSLNSPSKILYVGVQGEGVYRSKDAGKNWTKVIGGPDVSFRPVEATMSQTTLLVAYATKPGNGGQGKLFKLSKDQLIEITPQDKTNAGFASLDIDRNNPNHIVAIQWGLGTTNAIHESYDQGDSWTQRSFAQFENVPSYWPSWHNWTNAGGVLIDPINSNLLWVTTGFGVYQTNDVQKINPVWETKMKGLEQIVLTTLKSVPSFEGILAGTMDMVGFKIDNLTQSPLTKFHPEAFGITTSIDWCETDPSFVIRTGSAQTDITTGRNAYSTDGGDSWLDFPNKPANANAGCIAISATNKNHWVWAPLNMGWHRSDPHYTLDGGNTWKPCQGLPKAGNGVTEMYSASQLLVGDKVDGQTFYYFADTDHKGNWGVLYKSVDGGATFSLVNTSLPAWYQMKMEAVPGKKGHLLMSFRNKKPLYFSKDGGQSFSQVGDFKFVSTFAIGIGLGEEPSIQLISEESNTFTIYRSMDYMNSWSQVEYGAVPVSIATTMEGDRNDVSSFYLGTNGRGIWQVELEEGHENEDRATAGSCTVISNGGKPNPPCQIWIEKLSSTSLKLHWIDNSNNEDQFHLQAKLLGDQWRAAGIPQPKANATSQVIEALNQSKYQFRIKSKNEYGASTWVETNQIDLSSLRFVDIAKVQKRMDVLVHPNPVDEIEEFQISWDINSSRMEVDLRIFSMKGDLVWDKRLIGKTSTRVPSSIFKTTGLYVLSVVNGKSEVRKKVRVDRLSN